MKEKPTNDELVSALRAILAAKPDADLAGFVDMERARSNPAVMDGAPCAASPGRGCSKF